MNESLFQSPTNEVGQPTYQTRSPLPSVDWNTFFDAVNDAFNLQLKSAGPPGQLAPVFVSDFPKDNLGNFDTKFDVILFHIEGSVRAATDPSGKRRIPKGPNEREVRPHPTKARYSLVTYGWWELMSTRFTIYSLSHDRADQLAVWFHRMMMRYTFFLSFFKDRGVHYMTFDKRGPDQFSHMFGQEFYIRDLFYNVRLELLDSFEVKDLESLNFSLPDGPDFLANEQYPIPKP